MNASGVFDKICEMGGGKNAIRVVMFGDFGKDLDDENALVLAIALHSGDIVTLEAVIANLEPALERARLAKGTLSLLRSSHTPVGVGTSCFRGGTNPKHETDVPYLADVGGIVDGQLLLHEVLTKPGLEDQTDPVHLVLNSGLTDAALFFLSHPDLFKTRIASVTIMGGVVGGLDGVTLDESGFMLPQIGKNGAANNCFDEASALFLYRACQEHGIPLTIVMREAAYACQMPFALYDQLKATGNPIGANLLSRQAPSMNMLWRAANGAEGSPERGKLPLSRDRAWFVKTFCDGKDPGVAADQEIWPHVGKFQLYDPMNLVAAIPTLRDRFFDPIEVVVKGITHRVIGLTKERHGVKNPDSLRQFMIDAEVAALEAGIGKGI
ncbi:MAG: hypothetical protein Q7R83_01860 [bacterium]|nr:hypothetical protein [bacterium]